MSQQTTAIETTQGRTTAEDLKGEMVGFAFHLSKLNRDPHTIQNHVSNIERLHRHGASLRNPDSIITILATNQNWKQGTKKALLTSYKSYAKWMKITLPEDLPRFTKNPKLFYLPKHAQLDALIAGSGQKTSAFLQVLKETGCRSTEASKLAWSDIDATNQTITIRNPAKGSLPRIIQVSEKCIQTVQRLPHNGEFVFGEDPAKIKLRMRVNFHLSRLQIAQKTQDMTLLKIHLHSFRHYFASRLYQQTRDIRYVQKKLGHKSIDSTTIYENSEPDMEVKTYVSKVATTDQEKMDLITRGFESTGILTHEGHPILRKRVVGLD